MVEWIRHRLLIKFPRHFLHYFVTIDPGEVNGYLK